MPFPQFEGREGPNANTPEKRTIFYSWQSELSSKTTPQRAACRIDVHAIPTTDGEKRQGRCELA
jgi:hypothetical protein